MPDAPALALTWQLGYSTAQDGSVFCQLTITQGGLSQSVALAPDDMDKLAEQITMTARRARTGLIVPSPKVPPVNGLRAEERVS